MSYTRQEWCHDLLIALGSTSPTKEVLDFVVGWTFVETSGNGQHAAYNLLNTTEYASGSTDFNSAHVKNFVSYAQGIDINALLLRSSHFYTALYNALRTNDIHALNPIDAEVSACLQIWVSGKPNGDPSYVADVHNASGKGASDMFPGSRYTREQLVTLSKNQVSGVMADINGIQHNIGAMYDHLRELQGLLVQLD